MKRLAQSIRFKQRHPPPLFHPRIATLGDAVAAQYAFDKANVVVVLGPDTAPASSGSTTSSTN